MKAMNPKTIILIAGPTAAGKTDLAIWLAQHLDTSIISADSRQCFREMTIGTAKPSQEELQKVQHYFINSHSITQEVNAAIFEKLGLDYAEEIFEKKEVAILCGGTGLYIKAFLEGMDEIPPVAKDIRKQIAKKYAEKGLPWLQQKLKQKDPEGFQKIAQQNPQRLMRALEVWEATGQSIRDFQTGEKKSRDFNVIKIGLELPKEDLWKNIDHRTDKMIENGLVEEVQRLLPYKSLNALQTVGYKEVFDHLEGRISWKEAIQAIKIHTRQYAKRQMTWFKKDKEITWFHPLKRQEILTFLSKIKPEI